MKISGSIADPQSIDEYKSSPACFRKVICDVKSSVDICGGDLVTRRTFINNLLAGPNC